ncbi:MAG: Uma2 family endonuclease [Peptococcaceae bacterium]|nr:Uma2 family endonuclease [Peptococcaceae bacterium]
MRVSTTDLQNAFGKYLLLVQKEDVIIDKNGKSVAKLVKYSEPDYHLVHEGGLSYRANSKISLEEYMVLIESSDQRYELIDGVVYLLASPSFTHQVVISEIAAHFYAYFKGKPCRSLTAPLDVRLFGYATKFEEDPNVVQPDIVIICDEDKVNEYGRYEGTPSLIVEVLSPTTKGKDLAIKLQLYMKSGVSEYWIVDPQGKSVIQYIFTLERDIDHTQVVYIDGTIESAVFDGLKIRLSEIL